MKRIHLTILYLLLVLVGSAAFLSIAGIRVGVIEPVEGFRFIKSTVVASGVLCALFMLSCFIFRKDCPISTLRFYIICILISFVYSSAWIIFHYQKTQLPKISDIVTDMSHPLMYIRVADLRHTDDNDVSYPEHLSDLQKEYYPEIKSLILNKNQADAFEGAVELVQQKGWDIVSLYPNEGVIEATVTTPVFWFMDDVIIRVKPQENSSVVDMRSSSRIGHGDYGTNADRVRAFLDDLKLKSDANL